MLSETLKALQVPQDGPCLTVTLPTHRTTPDNRQDPIRLANVVRSARQLVTSELDKATAAVILERLEELVHDFPHQENLDGLAFFVSAQTARPVRLPLPLPERITIGERFAVQDLLHVLNRATPYLFLVLSDRPTRLYHGLLDQLEEVNDEATFPFENLAVDGETLRTNDSAINTALLHDEHQRIFFRDVDQRLKVVVGDTRPLLIVAGVTKYLALFHEVTHHRELIAATISGSFTDLSPAELAVRVEPALAQALESRSRQVLEQLTQAVDRRRSCSTLPTCRREARAGRIHVLMVEQHYHESAVIAAESADMVPADGASGDMHVDGGVDAVIDQVQATGGGIVIVPNGSLHEHGRIAGLLRY